MKNYEVKTPLRGFRRADGDREPIGAGEVVSLPSTFAIEALLTSGAIEPTDADESCPIDWEIAAFSMAMRGDVSPGPKLRDAGVTSVASDDRHGLVAAIGELGGVVFFVGEGLPDRAEEALPDFSNEQLLDELKARIEEGRLTPGHLNAIDDSDGAPGQPEPVAAAVEERSPTEMQATDVIEPPVPAVPPADAKPMRKKAAAK